MPIFWRYLFREFLKIFTLSLFGLVACLLITRLQEIAYFATLANNQLLTLRFTLYQIPYILPFAIPISSLIAPLVLFQKLSASHELTALRSAGLSLKTIKAPLKYLFFVLALLNFLIVSELTPMTRHSGYLLFQEMISSNPLLLLEKNKQLKLKNSYIDMSSLSAQKEVKDLILVLSHNTHLSLTLAESIEVNQGHLTAHHLTHITPLSQQDLMIENQEKIEMEASLLIPFLKPNALLEKTEHDPLKPLLQKIYTSSSLSKKRLARAKYELIRRFFFPLLTLTFGFLGMSFGCQIGRNKSSPSLKILLLATYALLCFLASKSQHNNPELAALLMLILPHVPLLYLAKRAEKQLDQGA
ncbi:MAG: LptF/LptG family permease [Simkaniaceae bacterium]|nr:LptF/LptG family permease [Simkaniaceae bacterium]